MPLFFGLKRPIEATADITILTGTVGYLTYIWSQVDEVAAWGIVPYLGWLSFATYLSVRTRRWGVKYNPTITDYLKYRRVLAISMTGTLRTRRPVRHHQTEARALTPNTSTRNRGSRNIFEALYAMYHESLCPGVGGVVLSRPHIYYCSTQDYLSLRPYIPHCPTPSPRPHLDLITTSLGTNTFLTRSSPPAFFLFRYTLHVPCASGNTLNSPSNSKSHCTLLFLSHHEVPCPLLSIPNSRYLSQEPLNRSCPILEVRTCAVVRIPRMAQLAPTRSQPFHARCGEGGSVARAR